MSDYYTILTTIGSNKIANALTSGVPLNLTEVALGDGSYEPSTDQTALVNEVWRGTPTQVTQDPQNESWIVVETLILPETGGFYIREVGVFDDEGDLIAIGKYPDTYKPVLAEGSSKDLYIRLVMEVVSATTVTLQVDPSIVLASRKYVDDQDAAHVEAKHRPPLFKSAAYTALSGDNIWVDTSAGEVPITFPANPEVGDKVFIGDHKSTWGTNACRLKGNGKKIMGQPLGDEALLDATALTGTWEFTGDDQGWRI